MKKNIVLIAGMLFILAFGLQIAEPVAAAKLVDQVSLKRTDADGQ